MITLIGCGKGAERFPPRRAQIFNTELKLSLIAAAGHRHFAACGKQPDQARFGKAEGMGQDLRIRNDDGKSGRQITPLKGDGTVGGILHDIFQQNCRVGFLKTRSMGSPVEFCQLNQCADRIIQVFSALMDCGCNRFQLGRIGVFPFFHIFQDQGGKSLD